MTPEYGGEQMLADLALINEIPLYAIPNDVPFTLDQHLAFLRLKDALPGLIAALAEAERNVDLLRGGYEVALAEIDTLRPAPGMTDLMVTPESIDAYLAENPPPRGATS